MTSRPTKRFVTCYEMVSPVSLPQGVRRIHATSLRNDLMMAVIVLVPALTRSKVFSARNHGAALTQIALLAGITVAVVDCHIVARFAFVPR
jgi:hypothetical protein